jgi:hypothetical protein
MHQARCLANVYFWNKYFIATQSPVRFKNNVPEEWALQIVDANELKLLKFFEDFPITGTKKDKPYVILFDAKTGMGKSTVARTIAKYDSSIILNNDEISKLPCLEFLQQYENGTMVIWQDLDRIFAVGDSQRDVLGARMIKVREHLSLVFHRYLSGEDCLAKVNIKINNQALVPVDPFLKGNCLPLCYGQRIDAVFFLSKA